MTPFDRLGRFIVRRAWWVVAAWVALLLVAVPFAPQVPGQLSAGGFILDDLESARAKALLETDLGAPPSAPRHRPVQPDARGWDARPSRPPPPMRSATSPTAPHVARVVSHLARARARSRPIATRPTTSSSSTCRPMTRRTRSPILRERLHGAPGLEVALAGGPAFYGDVQTVSEADLQRSELISLPLAALALLSCSARSSRPACRWWSAVRRSSSRSRRSSWSPRSPR